MMHRFVLILDGNKPGGVFFLAQTQNTPSLNRGNGLREVYTNGVKVGAGLFPNQDATIVDKGCVFSI